MPSRRRQRRRTATRPWFKIDHFYVIRECQTALDICRAVDICDCFIYFVHAKSTGLIKIGRTKNIKSRLSGLQTSSPNDLELVGLMRGAEAWEHKLHEVFADTRIRGEWFSVSPGLASFINYRATPIFGYASTDHMCDAIGSSAAWKRTMDARFGPVSPFDPFDMLGESI